MYWWLKFLPQWNSSCHILQAQWTSLPAMDLYTNTSGLHSQGSYWSVRWIQAQPNEQLVQNMQGWSQIGVLHSGPGESICDEPERASAMVLLVSTKCVAITYMLNRHHKNTTYVLRP